MHLALTSEQAELQAELRAYFVRLVDEVEGSGTDESTYTRYIRRMGEDRWLGIGWPEEYGGQGLTNAEQIAFSEEARKAGGLRNHPLAPGVAAAGSPRWG